MRYIVKDNSFIRSGCKYFVDSCLILENRRLRPGEIPSPGTKGFSNRVGKPCQYVYKILHPLWLLELACDLSAGNNKLTANFGTLDTTTYHYQARITTNFNCSGGANETITTSTKEYPWFYRAGSFVGLTNGTTYYVCLYRRYQGQGCFTYSSPRIISQTPGASCDNTPACSPLSETQTSSANTTCGATRSRSRSTLCAGGCSSWSAWSSWSGGTACTGGQTCSNGSCTTGGCTNATTPGTPVATAGNTQCTITENDAGSGYSYRIKQGTTGSWQNKSSHTFTGLTNNTTYTFYIQRKNTSGSCTAWSSSASASCTPASASSCSATTKNGCELAATTHNGTSGSCASDYTGTCSYTCNNGSWTKSSNNCSSCSVASVDWCESSGYSVSVGINTYDLYDIGCVSPTSVDGVRLGDLGVYSHNYCIAPSAINNPNRSSCLIKAPTDQSLSYFCDNASQTYCTVGNTVSNGDYVNWICKCGNQRQECESFAFSGECVNSGNGCSSGRDELVECPSADEDSYGNNFDPDIHLGAPNGPSAPYACIANYTDTNGLWGKSCSGTGHLQTGICCNTGYRCNGSVLQEYEKCRPTTKTGTTCSHGCWDPSPIGSNPQNNTDSKCHACATDSDCQCTGRDVGKTPKCETAASGLRSCKCERSRGTL